MLQSESELLAQARRAIREERLDDAQGILINVVVFEPNNDEAWLLLATTMQDPERKLACLEKARRIDPNNAATRRAIEELQAEISQAVFRAEFNHHHSEPAAENATPTKSDPVTDTKHADVLLKYSESMAQAVIMTTDPADTRNLGVELVRALERARENDATRTRRWATSGGRSALVKYEKALTQLITNLPQNDPQISALREQRQRALNLLK